MGICDKFLDSKVANSHKSHNLCSYTYVFGPDEDLPVNSSRNIIKITKSTPCL
jgi:hypothetical protein